MADGERSCRILSIQSHVVSGFVGNRSVAFPLQLLGFDVDVINSVQFSNHTKYAHCRGQVLDADQLSELLQGLRLNSIDRYDYLMSGYIGSASFLSRVEQCVMDLRRRNPNLVYACDPVLGDNRRLYVPAELVPIYRERIVPLADVLTPNQSELEFVPLSLSTIRHQREPVFSECTGLLQMILRCLFYLVHYTWLTDATIESEAAALAAIETLHGLGPSTVVLSSSDLASSADFLLCIASRRKGECRSCIRVEIPRIPMDFTGTGDLFSALLLAWLHTHPDDMRLAIEKVISTLQAILRRTLYYSQKAVTGTPMADAELRLIQSKRDIENPAPLVKAEDIELN